MREHVLAPVLVALVVLAGCGALPFGPASPSPTVSFPVGTSADGIHDAAALLETSHERLSRGSYRYTFDRQPNRSGQGVVPMNVTLQTGRRNGSAVAFVVKRGAAARGPSVAAYQVGDRLFRRYLDDDAAWAFGFERVEGGADPRKLAGETPRSIVSRVMHAGSWTYAGVSSHDGVQLLRFETTGLDPTGPDRVDAIEATLLVSESGVVRRLSADYLLDRDRAAHDVRVTVRYRAKPGVGPPERPAWVDEVPQLAVERRDDGVVALTNRGGRTVEAGANLSAVVNWPDRQLHATNLTLPTALAPGETVYLYAVETADGPALEVAASPPATGTVDLSTASVDVYEVGEIRYHLRLAADSG